MITELNIQLWTLYNRYRFQSLVGNMLAPGQKLTSAIDSEYQGTASVNIEYTDQYGRNYSDTFQLNPRLSEDFAYTVNESNRSDTAPSAIRQSTMALLRDLR